MKLLENQIHVEKRHANKSAFKNTNESALTFVPMGKYFTLCEPNVWHTLHKKWSFPLRISSLTVTKATGNCGFAHIYWRHPWWKTSFFVQGRTHSGDFCFCLLANFIMELLMTNKWWYSMMIFQHCTKSQTVESIVISPNFLVWKFGLSTKFPHQEIRWNYGILCSAKFCLKYLN